MIIHCPKCRTSFNLPKNLIDEKDEFSTLSCSICNHEWDEKTSDLLKKIDEEVLTEADEKEIPITMDEEKVEVDMDTSDISIIKKSDKEKEENRKTLFGFIFIFFDLISVFFNKVLKFLMQPRHLLTVILTASVLVFLISLGEKNPSIQESDKFIAKTLDKKNIPSFGQKYLNITLTPPINLITRGHRKFLLIKGSVENKSNFEVEFPPLKLETFNAKNQVIDFISKDMGKKIILPKEHKNFSIMLELSEEDYSYVEVNFVR